MLNYCIDVMDGEGTWNVAQVLSFPTSKEVEVKYDGWGNEYNEVVPLNSDRVAPYHTYTWSVKVWAKYKNWPWWPSVVSDGDRRHLRMKSSRAYCLFIPGHDPITRYRSRSRIPATRSQTLC